MEEHVDLSTWAAPPRTQYRHWESLSDGFLVSLVVVAPTFLFEELWRGRPMIDQGGAWWMLPALIMAAGFFAGGRVAGRNRSSRVGAFNQGILVATLTLVLIFLADLIRRMIVGNEVLKWQVLAIWVACSFGALLVGGVGGVNGRRGAIKALKRFQMERFH
jgi:drug/metabolite transporter (DMT)-like permease